MSNVFISHSGAEDHARQLNEWLVGQGFGTVFLDFDQQSGIAAGAQWKPYLFEQLNRCDLMFFLASEKSMSSSWCLAELHIAQYLGKTIVPLRLDDCDTRDALGDVQVLPFPEGGSFDFLTRSLGGRSAIPWDSSRAPYPGLDVMDEADAAVFFGRQEDLDLIVNRVEAARAREDKSVVAIVGASGVGKSSLLRAGVLRELRMKTKRWITIGPLRPRTDGLDQLARATHATLEEHGIDRSLEQVRADLADPARATSLWTDLAHAANEPQAKILIVIDQLEEALSGEAHQQDPLFDSLAASTTGPGAPVIVLATLRSDFVGAFQRYFPTSRTVELVSLGPLDREQLGDVIKEPAKRAGINIDDALVARLLRDCPNGEALPLLAFTLSKLHSEFGDENSWTVAGYKQLGGMEALIDNEAEAIIEDFERDGGDLEELERAFLDLAKLSEEEAEAKWLRQSQAWELIPEGLHDVFEQFVKRRLLVVSGRANAADGSGRSVEVSHESLFRFWKRLEGWLSRNRDVIRTRQSITRAAREWNDRERRDEDLLGEGRLEEAERIFSPGIDQVVDEYVATSRSRIDQRNASSARRRRRFAVGASTVAAVMAVLAAFSAFFFFQARSEAALSEAQALEATAINLLDENPAAALALAAESVALTAVPRSDSEFTLLTARSNFEQRTWQPVGAGWNAHVGPANAVSLGPNNLVASAGDDGVRLFLEPTGESLPIDDPASATRDLEFGPSGDIAAGLDDGSLWLWRRADAFKEAVVLEGAHAGPIWSVAWRDDETVATGGADGIVRLWDVAGAPQLLEELAPEIGDVHSLDLDETGQILIGGNRGRLKFIGADGEEFTPELGGGTIWAVALGEEEFASSSNSRAVNVWRLEDKALRMLSGHDTSIRGLAWSPSGALISAGQDGGIRLWVGDEQVGPTMNGHSGPVLDISIRPEGLLASAGDDGAIRLWEPQPQRDLGTPLMGGTPWFYDLAVDDDGRLLAADEHGGLSLWDDINADPVTFGVETNDRIEAVAFDRQGRPISGEGSGTITIWDVPNENAILTLEGHTARVQDLAVRADGLIASASEDGSIRLWNAATGLADRVLSGHIGTVYTVNFLADGTLVSSGQDGTIRLWATDTGDTVGMIDAHRSPIQALIVLDDGSIVSGSDDGEVARWVLPEDGLGDDSEITPEAFFVAHPGRIYDLAMGPEGLLATVSAKGHFGLTDLDHEVPRTFEVLGADGIAAALEALAVLPTGEFLTASADGGVRIWPQWWDPDQACALVAPYLDASQRPRDLEPTEASCQW